MDYDMIQQMRERLLLCSVCMNEYNDPRILPCHHSLCLECIASIVQSTQTFAKFLCPQCRMEICIPQGGIKNLPVNFYLVSLQDELGSKAHAGKCHICSKENVPPQFHCLDCDNNICRFCISSHRLEEHPERSNIVRISSSLSSSSLTLSHFCVIHSNEMLQLFCRTCQQAICITCSCNDHKRHSLIPLHEQFQKSKVYMQNELDKLLHDLQKANESKILIEAARKDVESTANQSLENLNNATLMACEAIMVKKSQVEKKIKSSMEIQVNDVNNIEVKLQMYINMLLKGQDFLSDMQEDDICMEAINSYKKYLGDLKAARDQYTTSNVLIEHNRFTPSHNLKAIDLNLGFGGKTIVIGEFGNQYSSLQTISVDSKTLEVNTKDRSMFAFLFGKGLVRFRYFLLLSFLFFMFMPMFYLCDYQELFNKLCDWFSLTINHACWAFDVLWEWSFFFVNNAWEAFNKFLELSTVIVTNEVKVYKSEILKLINETSNLFN